VATLRRLPRGLPEALPHDVEPADNISDDLQFLVETPDARLIGSVIRALAVALAVALLANCLRTRSALAVPAAELTRPTTAN
jgi:hypothetical protein